MKTKGKSIMFSQKKVTVTLGEISVELRGWKLVVKGLGDGGIEYCHRLDDLVAKGRGKSGN